ncbi:Dyp-type peroxidase family [Humibacillus xanthopallidus]|uniref:Dyp-type peroxidase family n=1 Tax=Humibacillus xanthopallidus TaxID=412689 RepID=A0A543PRN2_9MICO|nr:Dyp-type peroxidase [Humibacillus xanthopallidus]TQN46731.1 Dyp-type peroxidase family [Humibacillus xanthopallidus]
MVNMLSAMDASASATGQAPPEPVFDVDEIQGNVLPGFMKPRMAVIALEFGDLASARRWLGELVPRVTTMSQTMASRLKVRQERLARGVSAGSTEAAQTLDDAWLNVSLSYTSIANLRGGGDASKFEDEAFRTGLADRSSLLGDPTDPSAEGNPANWLFGGPGKAADALVVLGADRQRTLQRLFDEVVEEALAAHLSVLYGEVGGKLDKLGHEHFGFQDGVSQPGVRGLLPGEPPSYLTPRTVDPSAVPETWLYGLPGQYLVWPGAFVFGYPTPGADPLLAAPAAIPGPAWAKNGSYAVYRRLRQDVAGFRAFAEEQAASLQDQGLAGMTGDLLQTHVVGRWPSGAPLSRTPDADDPDLGADPLCNNHFEFAADTPLLPLTGGHDDPYPRAKADPVGLTCPLAAHIRKVNTRDVGNDQGGRRASFQRRLLRRGLPYGPPFPKTGPDPAHGDRGLMFLSYQASIVDQFEFLNTTWMGDPVAPRSPSGHDLLVGQNGEPGAERQRTCVIVKPTVIGTVVAEQDVVIPTGGGYFFTPSISALRDVLAATPASD